MWANVWLPWKNVSPIWLCLSSPGSRMNNVLNPQYLFPVQWFICIHIVGIDYTKCSKTNKFKTISMKKTLQTMVPYTKMLWNGSHVCLLQRGVGFSSKRHERCTNDPPPCIGSFCYFKAQSYIHILVPNYTGWVFLDDTKWHKMTQPHYI